MPTRRYVIIAVTAMLAAPNLAAGKRRRKKRKNKQTSPPAAPPVLPPPIPPPLPQPPFDAYCESDAGNYCLAGGKCACVKNENEAWICIQSGYLRNIGNCTDCEDHELCVVRPGVIYKDCALPCTNPV